jgi:glutathione S-transferase
VGESRYRPEALAKSGKAQFPVLVDPNYEPPLVIAESGRIVAHLWNNYGNAATVPLHAKVNSLLYSYERYAAV